ncbi:VOC family protein [Aquimarina sp. MAR_2010_214]|uniref:VOC family protein n=1 Tax=Aquimarina sp. MAR_2010_214 TaxID=1250026 RepID=UPI000C704BE4|nr:VOC family protein [Aquimarina sp. MAR_2010_214]
MKIKRTGLILYVKKYEESILFYETILELTILFKNDELTCFDLFGTYLMVEKEDREDYLIMDETNEKAFSCIRMNVDNVQSIANDLKRKGIAVDYQEHHWGKVAKFYDPDRNLIAFKDEETFAKQIEEYIPKSK